MSTGKGQIFDFLVSLETIGCIVIPIWNVGYNFKLSKLSGGQNSQMIRAGLEKSSGKLGTCKQNYATEVT